MCLRPVTIRNPKYSKDSYVSENGQLKNIGKNYSSKKEYIQVNCGQCAECRQGYINSIIQRGIVESLSSWSFFITLTYDNDHIPCIEIDGERLFYASYDDIQDMFKRFRAANVLDGRDFRYLCANEYGTKKFRPHFHIDLYIARRADDDETTPYKLREIIFNNLGKFFARNVGTRKHPKYEQLFTYRRRIIKGKEKSNYFVQFVEPEQFDTYLKKDFIQDVNIERSIRYLINYINKPNKYDRKVNCIIDRYKDDIYMYNKLKNLLKPQVRFSKGFGCGFTNGKQNYLEKISIRCSENTFVYTDLVNNLPDDYEQFSKEYEDLYLEVEEWREKDFYKKYKNFNQAKNHMTADDYLVHCCYMKYYKKEFSNRFKRYKDELQSTLSYHFNFTKSNYLYNAPKCQTYEPDKNSPLFKYLRKGVEEGIRAGVPFLAFKMTTKQKFVPLCKYYRDRVCTIDDTIRLYEKLGVKNYDEWLDMFNKQLSVKSANIEAGNEYKYYNDDEINPEEVQIVNNGQNIYNFLF